MFDLGEVVLSECYSSLESISFQNRDTDAWTGSVSVTFDSKEIAIVCEGCTGDEFSGTITVDGNTDSGNQAPTHCHNGDECVFRVVPSNDTKIFILSQSYQ